MLISKLFDSYHIPLDNAMDIAKVEEEQKEKENIRSQLQESEKLHQALKVTKRYFIKGYTSLSSVYVYYNGGRFALIVSDISFFLIFFIFDYMSN